MILDWVLKTFFGLHTCKEGKGIENWYIYTKSGSRYRLELHKAP